MLGASQTLFLGLLVGSVLPDIDMLWFHLVDHGSTHHHHYITHRPMVWAAILLIGLALRHRLVMGVGLGGLLHMCLDSIAGAITWGWPFFEHTTTLVTVQPTHSHWLMSFMAHWTFQVEIAITILAAILFWRANFRRSSE